jgi:hypothetical protein
MASRSTGIALAALGAALLIGVSAASSVPYLRSAGAHRGHVVVVFTLGDDAPGQLVVAVRPTTQTNGALVQANVRLKETMRPVAVSGGVRWQSRHTLRRGLYYVQVSSIVVGLDCTPLKPCRTNWSNVRRVAISRAG